MPTPTQKLTQTSLLIALGVALGFALNRIPNIELVTSTVFFSGYTLGYGRGFGVGMLTEGLYSMLNPYGPAAPPLLAAQVLSMGVTGLAGGWFKAKRMDEKPFFPFKSGLTGLACTCLFDSLTTLSLVPINHFSAEQLAASIALGIWFYVAHGASNTVLFAVLIPQLIRAANKDRMK